MKNVKTRNGIMGGILALIMLIAGFLMISPNVTSVSASTKFCDLPTNIPGVTFAVMQSSPGQELYTVDCTPPMGYEFVSIECTEAETSVASVTHKGGYVYELFVYYAYADNFTDFFEITLKLTAPTVELPPDPTKEGHTFIGWYLDEALTIPYEGQPITEDMTFYAKFEIHTFTVTFDSNGGSEISSLRIDWNVTPTLSTPVRDGYTFLGWLHNGAVYVAAPVKNDISLTAKWQLNTYTVEFDSAGGNEIASKLVDWNTPVVTDTPSRIGHTFLGWFVGEEKYEGAGIKANTTLTAHWQINKYTVTFMVSGEVYTTLEVEYGTSLKEVMKKNGLLFYSLEVVETEDGKILTGDSVTDIPIIVSVKESTNVQKFFSVVEAYWVYLLCGFIALCVLLTLLIMLLKKKR